MSDKTMSYPVLQRVLSIIKKVLLFLLLFLIAVALGLIIGYSVIGDGNFWEVFNQDTWRHIVEFIQ